MSWDSLKVAELLSAAEDFGVEVPEGAKKAEIIAALAEEGVTFEQYQQFADAEQVDPDAVLEPEVKQRRQQEEARKNPPPAFDNKDVLVKMERQNFRYEVYGLVFTKEHPFVVTTPEKAQAIFDSVEGFRLANPREVQEYYS